MPAKHVTDFTKELADLMEDKIASIQEYLDQGKAASRMELAKFVWSTAKRIWKIINPQDDEKRKMAWEEAKGMLKELVDFELFNVSQFYEPCVKHALEPKIAEVCTNYQYFILTGHVRTKHTPPKLLGETDELLCVDKPPMFTCNYGGYGRLPPRTKVQTSTQLLNCDKTTIQIHEYLALKFEYETAIGTKEFWKQEDENWVQPCESCACMQAGCCNRLDKETSGVMVAAKTRRGFPEIRKQFSSEHSLEEGGTEKFYFALVRGQVKIPTTRVEKGSDWIHGPDGPPSNRRGRIEIAIQFDNTRWKAYPCKADEGNEKDWQKTNQPRGDQDESCEQGESGGRRLYALTFYDPIAWFSSGKEKYTLLRLQIITGRTHQIRFHCAEIGHPLVADDLYGAPQSERDWAKRMFLHSYQTKSLEPFSDKWYQVVSPLPQDLGNLLSELHLDRVKEGCPLFLSRRTHLQLKKIFKQYDSGLKLLQVHQAPKNAQAILEMKTAGLNGSGSHESNGASSSKPNEPDEWGGRADWQSQSESWKWEDSRNGNGGAPKSNSWWRTDTNSANTVGVSNTDEDEDDECWGTWRPIPKATPVPEPEPQRPRMEVAAAEPANVAPIPRTPEFPVPEPAPAVWQRRESTRQPGIFYYLNVVTMETLVEPPPPWEKKQSRRDPSIFYYWNPLTGQTSVEKPEI